MGPIRAFIRPSHAAAHEHSPTTASFFCPTQPFASQHRPCCTHVTSSLAPHHTRPRGRHPFYATAADPLHAGLVSSVSQPCFYHNFRKFVPPTVSPLPVLTALSKSPGEILGADIDKEKKIDRWGVNSNIYAWGDGETQKNFDVCGKNLFGESKGVGVRNEKEFGNWKGNNVLQNDWSKWEVDTTEKERKGHGSKEDGKTKKEKLSVSCLSSVLQPLPSSSSTARVALFPFSDEEDDGEDDEELNVEGCVPGGKSRKKSWPISDIVETEDEGEFQYPETNVESITGTDIKKRSDKSKIQSEKGCGTVLTVENGVNGTDSVEKKDLSISSQKVNHLVSYRVRTSTLEQKVPEKSSTILFAESKDCSNDNVTSEVSDIENSKVDTRVPHQKTVVGAVRQETESCKQIEDEENEKVVEEIEDIGEEESDLGDSYRNGIRVTQRLRPRTYRQFLLTRERRSRVFLKERSYHLGRWFVTHFTHPYPSKEQKDILASKASMTRHQVSEWFGNMRRRIREATRGLGICWEERVRIYNSVITGKSEPLPILPEDEINSWVPPKTQESLVPDMHEVSASPKFKTALLHRYLNNPETPEINSEDDLVVPTSFIIATVSGPTASLQTSTSCFPSSTSDTNSITCMMPLCTSSPRDNIKELWNTSFDRIKDNYFPSIFPRIIYREQKERLTTLSTADECLKVSGKYEGPSHLDLKKPRLVLSPVVDWLQKPSTSRIVVDSNAQCHSEAQAFEAPKLPLSSWNVKLNTVDDEKSLEDCPREENSIRKPEELAAAYTLMELQHM